MGTANVEVAGKEGLVDEIAAAQRKIDKATDDITLARQELDAFVAKKRKALEGKGVFAKTLLVLGSKRNASYTFKDAYKELDLSRKAQLMDLFGDLYSLLFKTKKTMSVKAEKINELVELIGADRVNEFFTVSEGIVPTEGFMETCFKLREKLTKTQAEGLDLLTKEIGQRPSLSLK